MSSENNKRITLAALSPNSLSNRSSLGPARLLKEGKSLAKLSTLGSRVSLIGSRPQANNAPSRLAPTGVRRSSTMGKPATGAKPDPRPLTDKSFQASCIRCLIGYLTTHNYDYPVSPKMLASPMSKDFTCIIHFLMRQVDPNMNQKGLGKIEDDVPAFFKRMRYPFQISKSSLFAIGSPHTWPSLLASLVWIVELLLYSEKAAKTKDTLEDERQKAESDFFEYVSESYRCFLAGDDAKCDQVDQAKAAEFDEKAVEIEAHNNNIEEENAKLRAQISELQNSPSPLADRNSKLDEHRSNREKFRQLIENYQGHKQSLQQKIQERQSDVKSKLEQVAQIEQECKELQQKVAAQTFNREDVIRMNDERIKREGICKSALDAREALQNKVSGQELTIERQLDALEAKLQEYNTEATHLQLIPRSAKRAGNLPFEAKLNREGISSTQLVSVDFKGEIKAALTRLRDAATAKAQTLVEEKLALQERQDLLMHTMTERTEDNATLDLQVHKLEKQLTHTKEEQESEIRAIEAEADQIKAEVANLKDAATQSVAHSSGRVRTLQNQFEETAKKIDIERSCFNQDLDTALHMLSQHKQQVSSLLQKAHAQVAESVEESVENA